VSKRGRGRDKPDAHGDLPVEVTRLVADADADRVDVAYPTGASEGQYYEPYIALPGAIDNVTPIGSAKKKKKPVAPAAVPESVEATRHYKRRFDRYIDELVRNRGNHAEACAVALGLPVTVIEEDIERYRAEIARGQSTSSIADLLQAYGAGKHARMRRLAEQLHSPDDKVSLVANKLLIDIDGDKHDHGTSYEQRLRMIMGK
jgi:hypothetical protein